MKVLINQESLTHLEEVVGVDIDRELLENNKFRIRPLTSDYLRPRTHPFKVSLYQGMWMSLRFVHTTGHYTCMMKTNITIVRGKYKFKTGLKV